MKQAQKALLKKRGRYNRQSFEKYQQQLNDLIKDLMRMNAQFLTATNLC